MYFQRFDAPGGLFPGLKYMSVESFTHGCAAKSLIELGSFNWRNNAIRDILQNFTRTDFFIGVGNDSIPATLNLHAYALPIWAVSAKSLGLEKRPKDPHPKAPVDCTHYILPGVPDVWSQMLMQGMLALKEFE